MDTVVTDKKKIDNLLNRAVVDVLPTKKGLRALLLSNKRIRLYLGIDPTNSEIHIGNAIPLHKLRGFQEIGHEVIFLVGSFTALIGDPSDKESARKALTPEEVKRNMAKYKKLVSKILDLSKVEIRYNGDWLFKLSLDKFLEIASHITVPKLSERDLFKRRIKSGKTVWVHEFLYPIFQGYDSVAMNVDLEIGGTDQTFNMLIGRDLQKIYNNKEKYVLTTPLIEGTDGKKMSKSYGNIISIDENPNEMYGKLMALKDDLIGKYLESCTNVPLKAVKEIEKSLNEGKINPIIPKKRLAREIVTMYHSKTAAFKAEKEFERVVQEKGIPDKIREQKLGIGKWKLLDLLLETQLVSSKSEAKRLVTQGGVAINEKRIRDPNEIVKIRDGLIVRAGKREFIRIKT